MLCCALRFLHGFFNGNVLVAKTMIADITDTTNEAKGFALVSITCGAGTGLGPFVGGFLYNPASKWYLQWLAGGSLRGFFEEYPAFLPSLAIFLYTTVSLVACVLVLRETNVHRTAIRETALGRKVRALYARLAGGGAAGSPTSSTATAADVVVLGGEDVAGCGGDAGCAPVAPDAAPALEKRGTLSYAEAMRIDVLRNITIFYVLLAAADMTYGEILPLWGNASRSVRGMGLTENSVAVLILSYCIPFVVANIYFHNVCGFFGFRYVVFWRTSLAAFAACTVVIPLGAQMGSVCYYYVMLLGMVRQVGLSWCYSLIHMLTAKAAPPGCVGAAYGISQSMAGATRCVVPFVAAPLFAWSLRDGHVFPFNYYLVFLLSAVPSVVSVGMSYSLAITRTEAREVDAGGDVAADEDGGGVTAGHDGKGGSYASVEGDEGRARTCVSPAASLRTSPLHGTYLNAPELEGVDAKAARAMHTRRVRGSSDAAVCAVSVAEEHVRHAADVTEELPAVELTPAPATRVSSR